MAPLAFRDPTLPAAAAASPALTSPLEGNPFLQPQGAERLLRTLDLTRAVPPPALPAPEEENPLTQESEAGSKNPSPGPAPATPPPR